MCLFAFNYHKSHNKKRATDGVSYEAKLSHFLFSI